MPSTSKPRALRSSEARRRRPSRRPGHGGGSRPRRGVTAVTTPRGWCVHAARRWIPRRRRRLRLRRRRRVSIRGAAGRGGRGSARARRLGRGARGGARGGARPRRWRPSLRRGESDLPIGEEERCEVHEGGRPSACNQRSSERPTWSDSSSCASCPTSWSATSRCEVTRSAASCCELRCISA